MIKKMFASWEKKSYKFYPAFLIYYHMYQDVVQKEIELGNITSEDVVLNIGCGAIPYTAIHVSQMTGAKVIALDWDQEAIDMAKDCLIKYDLSNNIEIRKGNGAITIPDSFTKAIVALHVGDKPTVLDNLSSKRRQGADIIIRQPVDQFKNEYGYLPETLPPDEKVYQRMKTFKESFLYKIPKPTSPK